METLISSTDLLRLETAVKHGRDTLDSLGKIFEVAGESGDIQATIEDLRRLNEHAMQPRLVIGVVGDTGAGKSNLINALLDEEQLVPTSCMQACTAVVSEISYNFTDTSFNYQADVEFLDLKDWEKELDILRAEILDHDGRISEDLFRESGSEAAQAYLKIRAVYPNHSDETLATISTQSLLEEIKAKDLLGATRLVKAKDVKAFNKDMRKYVGSKTRDIGKLCRSKDMGTQQVKMMEYWPLIKVVRIFTKAKALSTGAVLVDLPGLQDSNMARAAVAEAYIKDCQAIWVVAPIDRAVDNRSANTLMSNAFKQQIKMDGMSGAITFVCTKTDDIRIAEIRRNGRLGLDLRGFDQKRRLNLSDQKQLREDIRNLERRRDQRPKLAGLYRRKDRLKKQEKTIHSSMKSRCIQARNVWSRTVIKQDFANGFRHTDKEAAEAQNPETFEQGESLRDYDQIAEDLSVFCVSSRAYLSLTRRLKAYDAVDGFSKCEQTEIPQLRDHCLELTVPRRRQCCQEFLRGFQALLDSLRIWVTSATGTRQLIELSCEHKKAFVFGFEHLKNSLATLVSACIEDINEVFQLDLVYHFDNAINRASMQALDRSDGWGKRQAEGGLHYNTYKATVRRDGVFHGTTGPRDFNADLVEPMRMALTLAWENVFTRRLPDMLTYLGNDVRNALQACHEYVNYVAAQMKLNPEAVTPFSKIIGTYSTLIAGIVSRTNRKAQDDQKGVNREFKLRVQSMMRRAYSECAQQSGPGSFNAMRSLMRAHVKGQQDQMFRDAARHVQQDLIRIPAELQSLVEGEFARLTTRMGKDFNAVLMQDPDLHVPLSDQENLARNTVKGVIVEVDEWIARISDPNTHFSATDVANTVIYYGTRTDARHYIKIDSNKVGEDGSSIDEDGDIEMADKYDEISDKIKDEPTD